MKNETAGEQIEKTDTDKGTKKGKFTEKGDSGRREVELGCGDGASNQRQRHPAKG